MKKEISNLSYEKSLKRLEEIIEMLEKGELTLDESLKNFEEGMELSSYCALKLKDAEIKIKKLIEKENQLELTDFTS
ncbi:MAG: exodeoxyribonuclease VII small subunit [Armatimonadetes bacterium]|nr:exodeoxyribonuclease VII small subunit [Armatimonadota bacterium]